MAQCQVTLGRGEHDAVQIVDGDAVVDALGDDAIHCRLQLVQGVETQMAQCHIPFDGFELDAQSGGVAEGSVGVGEPPEQVGVLAFRSRGDDVAASGQDVDLEDRFVGEPVAERRRLDAEAGDRAAECDGLELRNHQRRQPVREGGVHQVFVRAHSGDICGPGLLVDRDDSAETGDVEAGCAGLGPRPEQVGRLLRESHGGVRGNRAVGREKPFDAGAVSVDPGDGQSAMRTEGASTLPHAFQ